MRENLKFKTKIERDAETVKPTVINDKLIEDYLVTYNRENKIFDQQNMRIWDLTHLSISFKSKFLAYLFWQLLIIDIVEIDNLHGMEKLTKLQLDNNIITKIQGLECLVNLEWLDLSFNMITKIEGLDNCLKLTDLSLFKNRITVLSGLENLKELNVLSVGSNALANLEDSIDYLRKLKNKLEVLRISDNAFQKQRNTEYKKYTMARLKNLKYIDYELIEKKERE